MLPIVPIAAPDELRSKSAAIPGYAQELYIVWTMLLLIVGDWSFAGLPADYTAG